MRDGFDRNGQEQANQETLGARLDALFAAYREACPVPEASSDFMPRLWARIESRQETQLAFAWRRWAQAFLSLAAAACLLIVVLQVLPPSTPAYFHSTYIDQLSEDDGPEHMLLQDVATAEPRPALQPAALTETAPEGNNGR
jgi:hypothetical protein